MTAPLFGRELRQPDQRSCGPSCLVVARMVLDPAYAEGTLPRFDTEVLATHRRVVSVWPRALGTPPWAVAREMKRITGVKYSWRPARWRRDPAYERVLAGLQTGLPVPVYVGSGLLPRHVVLVVDEAEAGAVDVYNPAPGRLTTVSREAFAARKLGLGSWDVPWFTVTPLTPPERMRE